MPTISIHDYYKPELLKDAEGGTTISVKVVAVIGYADDWAAYWGPTDQSDGWIAHRGDKISRLAAEALFPAIGLHYK